MMLVLLCSSMLGLAILRATRQDALIPHRYRAQADRGQANPKKNSQCMYLARGVELTRVK